MEIRNMILLFERNYSLYVLLILFILTIYLITINIKKTKINISKNMLIASIALMIVNLFMINSLAPFQNHMGSMSEYYKITGKYFLENKEYMNCYHGAEKDCYLYWRANKSPGYPFLLSVSYFLGGANAHTTNSFNLILSIITPVVLFFSFSTYEPKKINAFLYTFIFIFNPFFTRFSVESNTVTITMLSFSLVLLILNIYNNSKKEYHLVLLLYSVIWLALIRSEYIVMMILFLTIYFKKIVKTKDTILKGILLLSIIFIVFIIFHAVLEKETHTGGDKYISPSIDWNMIRYVFENYGSIIASFAILLFFQKQNFKKNILPVIFFIIFFITVFLYQGDDKVRYLSMLTPILYFISYKGTTLFQKCTHNKKTRYIIYTLLIFQLLIFMQSHYEEASSFSKRNNVEELEKIYPFFKEENLIVANNDVTLAKFLFDGHNSTISWISMDYIKNETKKHNQTWYVIIKSYDYKYHSRKINDMKRNFNITLINETKNIELYDVKIID